MTTEGTPRPACGNRASAASSACRCGWVVGCGFGHSPALPCRSDSPLLPRLLRTDPAMFAAAGLQPPHNPTRRIRALSCGWRDFMGSSLAWSGATSGL